MSLNFGQNLFPPRGELLVNYDWVDISHGTGNILFYGTKSATTFNLIEVALDTGTFNNDSSSITSSGVTINPITTITFDTNEFAQSKTLKGIAYAVIPAAAFVPTGSGNNSQATITQVKLVKVAVGGGTTDLTNAFSLPQINVVDVGPKVENSAFFVAFNSISATKIGVGEMIRLSLAITGGGGWALLHNPGGSSLALDATNTATKTQLVVSLPFRIDI